MLSVTDILALKEHNPGEWTGSYRAPGSQSDKTKERKDRGELPRTFSDCSLPGRSRSERRRDASTKPGTFSPPLFRFPAALTTSGKSGYKRFERVRTVKYSCTFSSSRGSLSTAVHSLSLWTHSRGLCLGSVRVNRPAAVRTVPNVLQIGTDGRPCAGVA